mgnify:CR=1 FL=1
MNKKIIPGRYRVPKFGQAKKNGIISMQLVFSIKMGLQAALNLQDTLRLTLSGHFGHAV